MATQPGKGDPAAVTGIIVQAIQSPDTTLETKKYLLRALGRVGTADAVVSVALLLTDPNELLREEARTALESIRAPKAVEALEAALGKAVGKKEQIGLANSLGVQKSASSVPVVSALVVNPDPEIARAGMAALARIGGEPAAKALQASIAGGKVAPAGTG